MRKFSALLLLCAISVFVYTLPFFSYWFSNDLQLCDEIKSWESKRNGGSLEITFKGNDKIYTIFYYSDDLNMLSEVFRDRSLVCISYRTTFLKRNIVSSLKYQFVDGVNVISCIEFLKDETKWAIILDLIFFVSVFAWFAIIEKAVYKAE